jgi:hypothetical protein
MVHSIRLSYPFVFSHDHVSGTLWEVVLTTCHSTLAEREENWYPACKGAVETTNCVISVWMATVSRFL